MQKKIKLGVIAIAGLLLSQSVMAECENSVSNKLLSAAKGIAKGATGGYGLPMWVTYVDETGVVCSVVTTATTHFPGNSAWLGSRVISAQKANTANDFSLDGYAISTANLYSAVQPGGSLYGLQHSNPVNAEVAYIGPASDYGTGLGDPLVGQRPGGVNVFGGGLALYKGSKKIGAIGVSGDTSCADHANAWHIRGALGLHPNPTHTAGITTVNLDAAGAKQTPLAGAVYGDEIIINTDNNTTYWSAWSQPACPNSIGLGSSLNAENGTLLLN